MDHSLSFLGDISYEDKLLAGRILDSIRITEDKYINKFTFFLNEHQTELSRKVLASMRFENYLFFGGYEKAQRCILGLFPPYTEPDITAFPLKTVSFSFRKSDSLTHRDLLGCIMSRGVERDTVGDIIVSEGEAAVFVYDTVADDVLLIEKIGRVGVSSRLSTGDIKLPEQKFQSVEGTIASLRLDCVTGLALRISREKASSLINSGSVQVNSMPVTSVSFLLEEGDVFSVKRFGKFVVYQVGSKTKKDRIHIKVNKYI